jgi:spermidine synthase
MAGLAALTLVFALPFAARASRVRVATLFAGAALLGIGLYGPLYGEHLEHLQHARLGVKPFKHVIEDRTSVITVDEAPGGDDIMYGHGVYDGRFNIDPVLNSNLVDRAYMVAALHRRPRRILEVGLSTGSWTKVLSSYAPLEELVVVEIGRGYPRIVGRYPRIATVLADSRVRIHLDDGRRWLRNHPDERFDVIVMNTTYPWRSNSTNLLSREFLQLARAHLNPGGVVYYNAIGSDHSFFTAANVFAHVSKFSSMVVASDAPFDMTPEERRANLSQFKGDARLDLDAARRRKIEELVAAPLPELRDQLLARRDLWLITDDNLATEFKARY